MTVIDPPVLSTPFADVPADHPDLAAILWVTGLGLLESDPGPLFRLGAPVSRKTLARALHRYAGADDGVAGDWSPARPVDDAPDAARPRDVPADHPYAAELRWAVDRRLLDLDVGRSVRPDRPARRSDLLRALHRAAGAPSADTGASLFRDVPAWHGAARPVAWAVAVGLVDDDGSRLLRPSQPLSRHALAVLLHRFDELA